MWLVLESGCTLGVPGGNLRSAARCLCTKCGKTTRLVGTTQLRNGRSKSCGCGARPPPGQRRYPEVGSTFGRWTVLETGLVSGEGKRARSAVRCVCSCSSKTERIVLVYSLVTGHTRSCGCYKRDQMIVVPPRKIHGLSGTELYHCHRAMMARCYKSTTPNYPGYGGRGIRVHPSWHDVTNFIAWVSQNLGPRPTGHSLDRVNNDGHYAPGNVRWADAKTQSRNQRQRWTLTADEVFIVECMRDGFAISIKLI